MSRKANLPDAPKPKRIITVVTDPLINNFDVLGASYDLSDELTVRIHRQPLVNMRGTDVSFNFDIMIANGKSPGFDFSHVLPNYRYCKLPRYDKFTQAIRLANGLESFNNSRRPGKPVLLNGFMPVPTWYVGLNPARTFPQATGKVVIKPTDGARGIGHFVVDLDHVNLTQFNLVLSRYVAGEHSDDKFKAMIDSFKGHVVYYSHDENHPGEGMQALTEQGAVVQSLIPNIENEYRVITGPAGRPIYYQKRKVRDTGSTYPQATGGGNLITPLDPQADPFADRPNDKALFNYLCVHVIGPMNSIDVFTTKCGHWGIFEYCNQFGVSGIPADISEKMHADYMKEIVKTFIDGERGYQPEI